VEYEETAYSAVYFCLMQEAFQWALSLLGIWKRQEMFFPHPGRGMKIDCHLLDR